MSIVDIADKCDTEQDDIEAWASGLDHPVESERKFVAEYLIQRRER